MPTAKQAGFEPHTAFVRWLVDWVELDWDEEFVSGDPRIDRQHKDLFELTARLTAARDEGGSADAVRAALDDLRRHAFAHFAEEEGLLLRHEVPGAYRHIESHDEFRRTLLAYQKDLEKANPISISRMIDQLETWIRSHVRNDDRVAVAFLRGAT